jgi:hypothetical protein
MQVVPSDVREYVKMLMHINNELRPDAQQVMKVGLKKKTNKKQLNLWFSILWTKKTFFIHHKSLF